MSLEKTAKMIEFDDFESFREKLHTTEGKFMLLKKFHDFKYKLEIQTDILVNYLTAIMKEIERGFPDAPKCKKGCNCVKESLSLIRLIDSNRRWTCVTCEYKLNFKIGDKFGNCLACDKPYAYRR